MKTIVTEKNIDSFCFILQLKNEFFFAGFETEDLRWIGMTFYIFYMHIHNERSVGHGSRIGMHFPRQTNSSPHSAFFARRECESADG